jgi:hypothetical protein
MSHWTALCCDERKFVALVYRVWVSSLCLIFVDVMGVRYIT